MKRVLTSLAAALALAVPALAQVAQIGDTTYADFNSFFTAFQTIAASETPTTVTLLDDLTGDLAVPGTVPVKEGQAIVFDLNGRTMETALQREGRHYYAIDNYGTLTIKDSSAGQTGTIRARGVQNLGNGKLTIEGGTFLKALNRQDVSRPNAIQVSGGTFSEPLDLTFAKSPTGTTASYPCFTVRPTGHLTLTGTGTISESDPIWTPICVNGSGASDAKYACSVTVEENVTLKGWSGIVVDPIAKTIKAAYNVSITLAGKIEADTYGIYVNGGLSNATGPVPEIAVTETADIDSKGDGIYAAGYAKWTLAGQITARTAIVARSGVLTFKGGTYTSIMQDAFEEVAIDHPGGAVGTGAALSVSTADGYGATTIDIQGGTFVSANGPAIYEYAAPTIVGGEAPASQVTLAISDGTFTADGEYGALLLTAMDNPQVVSGGTFSTAVPEEFCTAGYASKQNADGTYSVVGWYESGVDLDADGVADAWVIRNEGDLAAFRDKVNGNVTFAGCTVTLAANLDLAGVAWIPIGEGNAGGASKNGGFFAGTFEGGDHLIANLSVSESKADEGAGLFGWVRGATIRNLSVSGSILSNANGAAGTHPIVELALSQEEAEGGRATLFTGTSLDDASGLEVTPVLPEGMDEPDDFVVTLEDELFYCDLLYLADRVAGESEGVTFDANAQQALLNAAGGSMHGNIAVSGRTAVDKPLTTAQVNEALACFEGSGLIVVEGSLEGEKTLVVAYDFGITDVRVTGTGDLVVEVAAQDMSGRPLAFAEGATLSLRNGETALAATPATVEGVTTLTVPAANVPAGELISKCVSSTHGPREDIVPRGFSYTLCPPKLSPDGTGGADFACGMGGGRGIMVMIFQSKEEP